MPSEKNDTVEKVGGDQIHLVRTISAVGEDASHRSRRAVAAPLYMMRK